MAFHAVKKEHLKYKVTRIPRLGILKRSCVHRHKMVEALWAETTDDASNYDREQFLSAERDRVYELRDLNKPDHAQEVRTELVRLVRELPDWGHPEGETARIALYESLLRLGGKTCALLKGNGLAFYTSEGTGNRVYLSLCYGGSLRDRAEVIVWLAESGVAGPVGFSQRMKEMLARWRGPDCPVSAGAITLLDGCPVPLTVLMILYNGSIEYMLRMGTNPALNQYLEMLRDQIRAEWKAPGKSYTVRTWRFSTETAIALMRENGGGRLKMPSVSGIDYRDLLDPEAADDVDGDGGDGDGEDCHDDDGDIAVRDRNNDDPDDRKSNEQRGPIVPSANVLMASAAPSGPAAAIPFQVKEPRRSVTPHFAEYESEKESVELLRAVERMGTLREKVMSMKLKAEAERIVEHDRKYPQNNLVCGCICV